MQILVWLDETDKAAFNALIELCLTPDKMACTKKKTDFWFSMTTKYPVLRDKPIAINAIDGYIFQWESEKELATYAKLRVDL